MWRLSEHCSTLVFVYSYSGNMVYILCYQLAEQQRLADAELAEQQMSADEVIETKRKDVSNCSSG